MFLMSLRKSVKVKYKITSYKKLNIKLLDTFLNF